MTTPLDYERFNKLFHKYNELVSLVKSAKKSHFGRRKYDAYIEENQEFVDRLFIENKKEQEKNG